MALTDLKLIQANLPEVNKLQENVKNFVAQLNGQLLSGNILSSIALDAAATVDVPHQLGRAYQGWIVLDQDGSAIIWRDASSTSDRAKFLPLKTSADVTINLWVF
jgi:hypothetical protein